MATWTRNDALQAELARSGFLVPFSKRLQHAIVTSSVRFSSAVHGLSAEKQHEASVNVYTSLSRIPVRTRGSFGLLGLSAVLSAGAEAGCNSLVITTGRQCTISEIVPNGPVRAKVCIRPSFTHFSGMCL